jgi:hypothetical protein
MSSVNFRPANMFLPTKDRKMNLYSLARLRLFSSTCFTPPSSMYKIGVV